VAAGEMDFDLVSRILFPAPPASYTADSFPGELIWIPRSLNPQTSTPEDCIPAICLRCACAQFLVLYFHSNAEDLGRCHSFCRQLRDRFQVHVLAVELPGYGICPGTRCDERGATGSASTALRFAREVLRWPPDSIIIVGRSVGGALAITLAMEDDVHGIALIAPFISVREACREVFGPMSYLIDERFPNKEHMSFIRSPCLIVHGLKDTTIPFRHGRELFEACRSRKRLDLPAEMDHNTNLMANNADFIIPMMQFFSLVAPAGSECPPDLQAPRWAFDKRLCPKALRTPLRPEPMRGISLFANCSRCTVQCGKCGLENELDSKAHLTVMSDEQDLVEETITSAIEHVLARRDEASSHFNLDFSSDDCDVVVDGTPSPLNTSVTASGPGMLLAGEPLTADTFHWPTTQRTREFHDMSIAPGGEALAAVVPVHTTNHNKQSLKPLIPQESDGSPRGVRSLGVGMPVRPSMSWRPHVAGDLPPVRRTNSLRLPARPPRSLDDEDLSDPDLDMLVRI